MGLELKTHIEAGTGSLYESRKGEKNANRQTKSERDDTKKKDTAKVKAKLPRKNANSD